MSEARALIMSATLSPGPAHLTFSE